MLRQVLHILHSVFTDFGLTLNMSKGKTEALCLLRGQQAATMRRRFFVEEFANIDVGIQQPLRLVTQYKHLGILVGQNLSMDQDLAQRIGRASTAFRSMTRTLFTNRSIPIPVRLQLLEALVLPRIFYGCGAWPLLTHKQFRTLAHRIMSWQRVILGTGYWSATNWTDDHLRAKWKLMDLSIRLAKHRLLYALQLHKQANTDLWLTVLHEQAICTSSSTWISAVQHALVWYESTSSHSDRFQLLPEGPQRVLAWLSSADSKEPRRIRHAVRVHLAQEHAVFQAVQGHYDTHHECRLQGVQLDEPDTVLMPRKHAHQCHLCTKSFATIQGLNAHLWSQHQHISLERRYVFSDTCLACGRCFWTPQRMQQHLRYSRHYEGGCLEFLIQHYPPLDQPVRFDIPDPHAHVHRLPWVYAEGPIPDHGVTVWDAQQTHRLTQVRAQWTANGFPEVLDPDLKASVFHILNDITNDWVLHPEDSDILVHDWFASTMGFLGVGSDSDVWFVGHPWGPWPDCGHWQIFPFGVWPDAPLALAAGFWSHSPCISSGWPQSWRASACQWHTGPCPIGTIPRQHSWSGSIALCVFWATAIAVACHSWCSAASISRWTADRCCFSFILWQTKSRRLPWLVSFVSSYIFPRDWCNRLQYWHCRGPSTLRSCTRTPSSEHSSSGSSRSSCTMFEWPPMWDMDCSSSSATTGRFAFPMAQTTAISSTALGYSPSFLPRACTALHWHPIDDDKQPTWAACLFGRWRLHQGTSRGTQSAWVCQHLAH